MALDLLRFDPHNPDPHWMYAHATLQRLFRTKTDGRHQFWPQVPGFKAAFARANLVMNNFNSSDRLLAHFIVELEGGWLNILGGTEWPLGWPYHSFSLIEPPNILPNDSFPTYWWVVGGNALVDIATVIQANDARPIMFSGHSLGGASSIAAAYRDFDRGTSRDRAAVTFGCPLTRSTQGMGARDFPCCRIWNKADMVPSLPQHLIKVGVTAGGLVKVPFFNLYHHGLGVMVSKDGEFEVSNGGYLRGSALAAGYLSFTAFNGSWDPFIVHYIDSYALFLRLACVTQGVAIDPFWDKVNAFINEAVGLEWQIGGFPLEAPPAQGTPPPPPVNLVTALQAEPDFRPFTVDLLSPRPDVPLLTGQSLANYLNSASGSDFADITCHLAQEPILDPANVTLASFTECDFSGYQPFGGKQWVTINPALWTPARRFAARAVFRCIGQERANIVYAWYCLGHKNGSGDRVLLDWSNLGNPFAFDRPRSLCIEFSLAAGPA